MTERRPPRAPRSPERSTPSWDTDAIARTLGAAPETRLDELRGPGVRLRLGDPPVTDLDLFPGRSELRVATADLSIALRQPGAPILAHEAVVFESPTTALSVNRSGALTLVVTPTSAAPESPAAAPTPSGGPDVPPEARSPVVVDPEGSQHPSPTPAGTTDEREAQAPSDDPRPEREPRVRLTGRLGTDVRYRETRTGTLIASFPVAVTQDDESVEWRNVKMFGDRAARLRDAGLARGQLAEIVGYLHRREVVGKGGETRTEEEVYAVVVRPR